MMPTLNYGSAGANQITGTMHVHPGTYGVRQSTLRSIIADIGGQIAQNRFKWIFVLNGHGAPTHHIAVNEAVDFVSETFSVTMLNVSGLFTGDSAMQARGRAIAAMHFSPAQRASFGLDVHAGVSETSGILAIQPELVRPSYRSLRPNVGNAPLELRGVAKRSGWQGYFSSPGSATAAYGRDIEAWWIEGTSDLILAAVRGANLFNRPRAPVVRVQPIIDGVLAPEREFEAKLERWLATRKQRR
jgi:creatinine amidohydrolase/Fe(II)-dependent formamide hydrolase-like protein